MQNIASGISNFAGWLLFLALSGATLALGANRPFSWTVLCFFALLTATIVIVTNILAKRPRMLDAVWLPGILYAGALLWGAIQLTPGLVPQGWAHPFWADLPDSQPTLISADPSHGRHVLMRLASYGLIFWVAVRCFDTPRAAYNGLRAFALFSMGLAFYGIYAGQSGENMLLGDLASNRVTASFVNRNSYATFAGFGLVTCLALLLRASGSWERQRRRAFVGILEGLFSGGWLWILGLLLCGGALMLTQSRAGAMAGVIGVLTLLTTLHARGRGAAVGPVLLFGGIVAMVLISASTSTVNRFLTTSGEEGRFAVYPEIWATALERPLLGHGLGSFQDVFRGAVPVEAAFGAWDMAHNSYLENILELGLPAAIAFYLALALVGLRLLRGLLQRRRDRTPIAVAFACFLLAGFHAVFDFSLQMPALAGFFAWLIGIGYAQSFASANRDARAG